MNTPSSALNQGSRDHLDTGPLSWVIGEIREALNRSGAALRDAAAQDTDAQATSLQHAKSFLHQAHGALQIVDIDGLAIITETVEDLLDRISAKQLAFSSGLADAVSGSYQALIEYLEELLSGAPHQPVRLFPYYRALLQARGAERIHPADLFFPNLSVRPKLPPIEPINVRPSYYARLRKQFEMALLPFLKSADPQAEANNAAAMREIIGEIERLDSNQQTRPFWWVMHGLAEAVAAGQVRNEIYVKQLFARINLQIRRLSQGSASIAERLLRDALFFIAKVEVPTPRARQIRTAYGLDGLVPADYESKRYGQIDVSALAQAKERLSLAKNMWNRIAGGDAGSADSFLHEMHMLVDAGAKLNSAPLTKLLRELKGIARHAANARPGDALSLEVATSLLFVENALNNIGRLPENFADRADALTARLLAVVSGEQPAQAAAWLSDMSREAQQRQTMTALSSEMQNNLRHVEKMLDEFFRDPDQSNALEQLDTVLHQVEGALAVLDQDDAVRTVRHTRAAVRHFADARDGADQQQFQQVARNVGALGFFIEQLQLDPDGARKRFSFDEEQGVFQVRLIDRQERIDDAPSDVADEGREPASKLPEPSAQEGVPVQTVEDELAYHQQQSAELAMSLTAQPDNLALQEQLKESLQQIRLDAALLDNPELNDRAQQGIEILQRPDFSTSPDALAEIITATVPAIEPAGDSLPPVLAPSTDEAIDAELLEIFLTEAVEVLGTVRDTLPMSRQEPHNQESLTTLRRSFHTLKGSSRMVGLTSFGEAAWSIEQVLNLRLSEARSGDAELYALLEKAAEVLGKWVDDLVQHGRSTYTPHALVAAADRVKNGDGFHYDEVEAPASQETVEAALSLALPEQTDTTPATSAANNMLPPLDFDVSAAASGATPDQDFPSEPEAPLSEAHELQLSDEEMAIFAPTPVDQVVSIQQPATSSPAVGAKPAPSIAIAEVIEFPTMQPTDFRQNDGVKRIGNIEISLPLHNIYLAETDELVRLLAQDFSEWRHEPERSVSIHAVHAAHSLAGSSATVGFTSLQEGAHALEMVLQQLARSPVHLAAHDFDTLEQTVERFKLMLQKFALGELPRHEPEYARLLNSMQANLEARTAMPAEIAADIARTFEDIPQVSSDTADAVSDNTAHPDGTSSNFADTVSTQPGGNSLDAIAVELPVSAEPFNESAINGEATLGADAPIVAKDEIDADLLPVFLEEGRDGLPQLGELLRSWQAKPTDPAAPQLMLRLLHTLKGSARMAGAMELGQQLHDMETRVENLMHLGSPSSLALDDLLFRYDRALQLFEHLQHPDSATPTPATSGGGGAIEHVDHDAGAVALAPATPVHGDAFGHPLAMRAQAARSPAAPSQMVRVRADILDRLVNQAGEVSISRSKLENEVGTLRQSLTEMTENVVRLRDQLREIEMQAETQITSRMAQSADREFDPLEFDRFTRLQELTRMMAESVSDVTSVQQNLSRTLDTAADDLALQARLTRELQQDLMRVRMVQFASIAERLYRVTRQAAKEVDKRVNLDIRGSGVEIDRGVLEKMTGPFEHLLRNAIAHGIETREARQAAGKNETGELLVEVRQEGNEVVIRFSDDGQGLNVGRIRDKAQRIGLLQSDEAASDEEVRDLIFHPGFSTADEVTELAGRGIGMDVVRSEAASLGGRVSTWSEPGKGTQFTIHLPLTLAVTQVVLLSSGGHVYAVPSVLVEQVQQLRTNALAAAYNDGAIVWSEQRVPLHYLPGLLGDRAASPVSQQYSPILILRSGNDRIAIHVDEVIGNREVVVKNIGPQLSRLIGIAGATVLGSGDIVLILNPVPLALRAAHENQRALRSPGNDAPEAMGAVAEMAMHEPLAPKSNPVQGLRKQHIVMVVDDSLTVRRVTQRLLSREGYQVVLAKDGVDALEQLQSVTPDVMLVDIEMPRMDGFDLTRNVRDDERTRRIPIIMITSRTAAKHRNYALEIGVNEYLGKPYQEDELLRLIAGYVGREVTPAE